MVIKKNYYFDKYLHHFLFVFLILISYIYYCFCYNKKTDFDYPIKKRLNNGNYIVMTAQGIYLYDEEFKIKMEVFIYADRLLEDNIFLFSNDIVQFWTEDDGYIICLIQQQLYILSKNCIFVGYLGLDYFKFAVGRKVVPYKHIDNKFYFSIISIENQNILIENYVYSNFAISFEGNCSYPIDFNPYNISLTCELMKYSNNKVIVCFVGGNNFVYFFAFNTI